MKIDIVTLFPELFAPFLEWSMIKKARELKALDLKVHDLRKWAIDERGTVDDHPYGGGPGMILRPEPIYNALRVLSSKFQTPNSKQAPNSNDQNSKLSKEEKIILLSPKGKTFNQKMAQKLAKLNHLILICGHYEGVDERVRKYMIDEEISIGNYVLSGGELPAMVVTDAVSRLLPGVLEKEGAAEIESFSPGLGKLIRQFGDNQTDIKHQASSIKPLLEFPHYTRPPIFKGWKVPKILLSGNHQEIAKWRAKKIKTKQNSK
jgi:tRNA (guanine37-N1)-methyltransferase